MPATRSSVKAATARHFVNHKHFWRNAMNRPLYHFPRRNHNRKTQQPMTLW